MNLYFSLKQRFRNHYLNNESKIFKATSIAIILNAILLAYDVNVDEATRKIVEKIDNVFFFYFGLELILRTIAFKFNYKLFASGLNKLLHANSKSQPNKEEKESLERTFWLIFDSLIMLGSIVAFIGLKYFSDMQLVFLFRMVRLFRILKVFAISREIKKIERRIIAVIPTLFYFALLLGLIIFVFAIIGSHLYTCQKFEKIDFTNLRTSMVSLFSILTNGWDDALTNLKSYQRVPHWISELYILGFFISAAMVTLNVFLAVMTSVIYDNIQDEISINAQLEQKQMDDFVVQEKNNSKEIKEQINELKVLISKLDIEKFTEIETTVKSIEKKVNRIESNQKFD